MLELAITPDRGYALSVRGLGRDLACAFDLPFGDPVGMDVRAVSDNEVWPVDVQDEEGCRRFVARRVTGVDTAAPTPFWMRRRLMLAGIRSISLPVDVTNYVMLETGQPLHAFDAAKLQGTLVVRRAKAGEKLRTLDDVERTLSDDDMIICDDSGPVSLAGVMGGASTEVGESTHRHPAGGGQLGAGLDRPHRPPAQAAQRGVPPFRACRRPRRRPRPRARPRGQAARPSSARAASGPAAPTSATRCCRARCPCRSTCPTASPACTTPVA